MTRRSVTVVTLRYNSWWNRRWLYPRFRSFPCAGKMTESHYTIAHYDTNTGRLGALGLQLSAACTRVTISEPKTGSKRLRAALGVQISFFFWTEKGFQFWNGGIWCLRGWGNLRIFTRNGRRGADFHMLAGRIAAACAFWNIKRLLNLNSLIFWGGNFQLGCTWQHFGRDFKAKIELIRAPARWVWDFAPDNFRACVCCPS